MSNGVGGTIAGRSQGYCGGRGREKYEGEGSADRSVVVAAHAAAFTSLPVERLVAAVRRQSAVLDVHMKGN